jgi:hypothetical protein
MVPGFRFFDPWRAVLSPACADNRAENICSVFNGPFLPAPLSLLDVAIPQAGSAFGRLTSNPQPHANLFRPMCIALMIVLPTIFRQSVVRLCTSSGLRATVGTRIARVDTTRVATVARSRSFLRAANHTTAPAPGSRCWQKSVGECYWRGCPCTDAVTRRPTQRPSQPQPLHPCRMSMPLHTDEAETPPPCSARCVSSSVPPPSEKSGGTVRRSGICPHVENILAARGGLRVDNSHHASAPGNARAEQIQTAATRIILLAQHHPGDESL